MDRWVRQREFISTQETSFSLLLRSNKDKEVGSLVYNRETGSWLITSLDLLPHLVDRRFLFLDDAISCLRKYNIDLRKS